MTSRRLPQRARLAGALAATLTLAAPAAADAAPTVTGKLARGKGYTVTLITPAGTGVSRTVAANGAFSLPLPKGARGATIQLVGPGGRYYGPLVLASKRGKAHTALSGRAVKLGTIKLRGDWAAPVKQVAKTAYDPRTTVTADRNGKPSGAGLLGLVKGARPKLRAAAEGGPNGGGQGGQRGGEGAGAGSDPDRDGVPSAVDADDNGNLVLDAVDPQGGPSGAGLFSSLNAPLDRSLNANAGTVTREAIDASLVEGLGLGFYFDENPLRGATATSADVDCFTLSYCRRGSSTGRFSSMADSGVDLRDVPWTSYDPNGDGLPNLIAQRSREGRSVFAGSLNPRSTTAQIRPGDTFDVRFTTSAGVISVPTSLSFLFNTTPAIASWDDGTGVREVTYPVAAGGPGTRANPLRLAGDRLTLSLWRPQRAPIGAETGFIDMGGLVYGITIEEPGQQFGCPAGYSALSPTLAALPQGEDYAAQLWPLRDTALDAPANPANRLSFTLDLGGCLRSNGIDPATRESIELHLTASGQSRPGGSDRASQTISVALGRP